MPKRIFFHHIQKTAGVSLNAAFAQEYGAGAVTPRIDGMTVGDALQLYHDKAVVSGHFQVIPGTRLPAGFHSLTVLRDPLDRYVSHLFFALHLLDIAKPADPAPPEWWDMVLDLEEQGRLALRNWQVESLYRYAVADDLGLTEEQKLEAAIHALNEFTTVGVVGELQDFLAIVAVECGWRAVPTLAYDNATRSRPKRLDLEPRHVARIEALNHSDTLLWEHARARFNRSRSRVLFESVGSAKRSREPAAAPGTVVRPAQPPARPVRIESGTREMRIVSCRLSADEGDASSIPTGAEASVHFILECRDNIPDATLGIRVLNESGDMVFGSNSRLLGYRLQGQAADRIEATWRFCCDLGPGRYRLLAALHPNSDHNARCFHYIDPAASFRVAGRRGSPFEGRYDLRPSLDIRSQASGLVMPQLLEEDPQAPEPEPSNSLRLSEFAASIECGACPATLRADELIQVPIRILNRSGSVWPCSSLYPVHVSYRWRNGADRIVGGEGIRTALPRDVRPGESVTVAGRVRAPRVKGLLKLQWTLVQEGVAWFGDRDPASIREMPIRVASPGDA